MNSSKNSIINKYRPKTFEDFLGNESTVSKLKDAVEGNMCPHTFLFTGIAGLGKTTLARIIADKINATPVEQDAASYSSVDDTRQIVNRTKFLGLTERPNTMFIIDECHDLSQKGWEPLLKVTEEPPAHIYFSLCTTNYQKVPETIRTRSYQVHLKPADPKQIEELLEVVCSVENWQVNSDVFNGIIQAASGSFRKALSLLQVGHSATSRAELTQIISGLEADNTPAIEMLRYLLQGKRDWKQISGWLEKTIGEKEVLPEITRYITSAVVKSSDPSLASVLLDELTRSRSTWDEKAQLVVAVCGFLARTER